jgi:hypothetical protein
MSEPIKNDAAGAAVEETKTSSRMSLRRKRAQGIVEPESKVERPTTVAVFQASPTSIGGVLAKHGAPLETTLEWGQADQAGPSATKPPAGAVAVFVVGSGREFLAEVLEGQAGLQVGAHGDALAGVAQTIRTDSASLAHEGFPEQYWYKKAGDEFSADRAADAGARRWVEIVDTATVPFETLDRLFPRCLVVNVVGGWLQGGLRPTRRPTTLSAGRYLEVRIADVKANPELVARQVLEFLGEEPSVPGGEAA